MKDDEATREQPRGSPVGARVGADRLDAATKKIHRTAKSRAVAKGEAPTPEEDAVPVDVGVPARSPDPVEGTYNMMFRQIMARYVNVHNMSFNYCVFDHDKSLGETNGGNEMRRMVNDKFIETFEDQSAAQVKIDGLRNHIYGDSEFGGSSDINLRSGFLDQKDFQLHWQKIESSEGDSSFKIFWYTSVLAQTSGYVPSQNQNMVNGFDTEIAVVAFPAAFVTDQFGNDFYTVQERFKSAVQLLNSVVPLRPPLDQNGPATSPAEAASAMFEDNIRSPPTNAERYARGRTGADSGRARAMADRSEPNRDGPMAHDFMSKVTEAVSAGKEAMKAVGEMAKSDMFERDDNSMEARAYRDRKDRMAKYREAYATAETPPRVMTPKHFADLQAHGWEPPPDHGYGEHPDDHPHAQGIVYGNNRAHRRHFHAALGKDYDPNDPQSLGFMDAMKKGAMAAAAGAAKLASAGAKVAGKAATAAKAKAGEAATAAKAKVHALTAKQFKSLQAHGWEHPPDNGYGEHHTDHRAAQAVVYGNQLAHKTHYREVVGQPYDENEPESFGFMDAMKKGAMAASNAVKSVVKKGAEVAGKVATAAKAKAGEAATAAKAKVHALTSKQLTSLKAHGWEHPPDNGYGEQHDDHPDAQATVYGNHLAHKKHFHEVYGKHYDENDPQSFGYMQDLKAGAMAASNAAQRVAKTGAKTVGKVANAVGRAGAHVVDTVVRGNQFTVHDPDYKVNLEDRHVLAAARYTNANAKSIIGLAGLYSNIEDNRVRSSFRIIAGHADRWASYCHIIGHNAWITTEARCNAGMNGMRSQIINSPDY